MQFFLFYNSKNKRENVQFYWVFARILIFKFASPSCIENIPSEVIKVTLFKGIQMLIIEQKIVILHYNN